jgi:hypothetical protein
MNNLMTRDQMINEEFEFQNIEKFLKKILHNKIIFNFLKKRIKLEQLEEFKKYVKIEKDKIYVDFDAFMNHVKNSEMSSVTEDIKFFKSKYTHHDVDPLQEEDWGDQEPRFIRILNKTLNFPINVCKAIWNFWSDFFEDNYIIGSILGSILTTVLLVMIFVLGILFYQLGAGLYDNSQELDKGVVVGNVQKVPGTVQNMTILTKVKGRQIITYEQIKMDDTYYVEVKEVGGDRVEVWSTNSPSLSSKIKKGDTLDIKYFKSAYKPDEIEPILK